MKDLDNKYVDIYFKKTGENKIEIQNWIPIVAAVRKTYDKEEEREFLDNLIDITDFQ